MLELVSSREGAARQFVHPNAPPVKARAIFGLFSPAMTGVPLSSVDLNLLVAFDALLAEGHVTRAARRVGVTQSAMSHALGRLRELFSDPLFVRTPRGMLATPRAVALGQPLRHALAEISSALQPSAGVFEPRALTRTFTVAAADFAQLVLLPPLLEKLRERAPLVDLCVRAASSGLEAGLESGEFDVAIALPARRDSPLYQQKLFDEQFRCAVRKGHPAARRKLTVESYARLLHAQIALRGMPGGPVDDALARRGLTRRVVLRLPNFLVAPMIISTSDLVLTGPDRMLRVFEPVVPLQLIDLPLDVPGFTMVQLWHERQHRDPAHAWLRALVAEVAAEV